MNKLMTVLVMFSTVSLMSGCVSKEQRLAKCRARGISRDIYYHEEKEYWNSYSANTSQLQAINTQANALEKAMNDHEKHRHHDDD